VKVYNTSPSAVLISATKHEPKSDYCEGAPGPSQGHDENKENEVGKRTYQNYLAYLGCLSYEAERERKGGGASRPVSYYPFAPIRQHAL
jgi:hypothetical protein